MKITTSNLKLILFAIAILCLVTVAAIAGGGCGSGDDDGQPDANTVSMTDAGHDDGDATMPPTADAMNNSDPCADYYWMAEKPWTCYGNIDFDCVLYLDLLTVDGVCGIQCPGYFWMSPNELTISKNPPPSSLTYYISGTPITCYQQL